MPGGYRITFLEPIQLNGLLFGSRVIRSRARRGRPSERPVNARMYAVRSEGLHPATGVVALPALE